VESLVAIFGTEETQEARFRRWGAFPAARERWGEHEGHESYLWMGPVEAGVAGGGPAAVGLGHGRDVPAC
jgi:hypothetical protein